MSATTSYAFSTHPWGHGSTALTIVLAILTVAVLVFGFVFGRSK